MRGRLSGSEGVKWGRLSDGDSSVSITEERLLGESDSSPSDFAFITSPGCSYMLNDLLILLGRGREWAALCFLMAARGEPLLRDWMLEPKGKGLIFDDENRDPLEHGRRSCGGEGAKHSSSVGADVLPMLPKLSRSQPAPNLNGCCSCCLNETVLVEKFFVRASDGRRRMDFLRLRRVSKVFDDCSVGSRHTQQRSLDEECQARWQAAVAGGWERACRLRWWASPLARARAW